MLDLNSLPLPRLFETLIADGSFDRVLLAAIEEDFRPPGDITTDSIVPASQHVSAAIVARRAGVIAGVEAIRRIMSRELGAEVEVNASDGQPADAGQIIVAVRCELRPLLGFERLMLNLLGRLSGVATLARQFVEAVAGTNAAICDTRKTTPGLRNLEKYAVRCGGGLLHRTGLFDAALYKDNHLAGIGLADIADRLTDAIRSVRHNHDVRFVEVEVDTLEQLAKIMRMQAGLVDIVLLDNMTNDQLREAVSMRDSLAPQVSLECSGGVTLERVRSIAQTGVDRISVGAITHSASWLDVGLDIA